MAPVYKGMLVYILVYQLRDRVNVWHEDATLGHANFKTAALYLAYKGLKVSMTALGGPRMLKSSAMATLTTLLLSLISLVHRS